MRPGTRVGLIQRRTRQPVFDAIARQIEVMGEADLQTTQALAQIRTDARAGRYQSALPPELRQLRADLRAGGFI
jgi:hypothetical protein